MATAADTPVATDPVTGLVRSPRDIVPADLWEKQVGLLMRDCPYDSVMAARVLGQGYAYLLTAMSLRGQGLGLAPSKLATSVPTRSSWTPSPTPSCATSTTAGTSCTTCPRSR
ncbi:hypothetical protein FHS42_001401 [Streptomyces zagrosensis]|uniref:Uncharacterized protein n=1 Tax=Streptomyces zagrosensis TaxID=1042984 RepID=A0A7W9Q6C4_9ACTN|nr:hypothetical protein [Streptomyces zagrosensis]